MIDVNQQALLELLKRALFTTEPRFPEGVDWDAVLQEARDQTVAALAASAVPADNAGEWQLCSAHNKMVFFQNLHEQTQLVQLFRDAGIPMAILKGSAAAMYYPVPMDRTMGDIDFYVPPERLEEAHRLMLNSGYAFLGESPRHYNYEKNGTSLELHHRYCEEGWDFESLILQGVSDAALCEIYGQPFFALPPLINGLVILDHVRHHMKKGLGLRQIIDWMMFVHAVLNTDAAWEERFAPLVRPLGLEALAMALTKMCRLWLGLPDEITWCDGADSDTALRLLELVFHFGNFGRKYHREGKSAEKISLGIRKQGFFRFLQRTGRMNWAACQKHRWLTPFAWLYQLLRYVRKGIASVFRGESFSRDAARGKERADLYKELNIDR